MENLGHVDFEERGRIEVLIKLLPLNEATIHWLANLLTGLMLTFENDKKEKEAELK